jgi:hypothetical protein
MPANPKEPRSHAHTRRRRGSTCFASEGWSISAIAKPVVHAGERHELRFLSSDDLVVFKISFGRSKDWIDLAAMVVPDYVQHQLVQFKGTATYRPPRDSGRCFDRSLTSSGNART